MNRRRCPDPNARMQKTEELQIKTENTNLRLRKYQRCIFLILSKNRVSFPKKIQILKIIMTLSVDINLEVRRIRADLIFAYKLRFG